MFWFEVDFISQVVRVKYWVINIELASILSNVELDAIFARVEPFLVHTVGLERSGVTVVDNFRSRPPAIHKEAYKQSSY